MIAAVCLRRLRPVIPPCGPDEKRLNARSPVSVHQAHKLASAIAARRNI